MNRVVVYLAGPVRGPNAMWRDDFIDCIHTQLASPHFIFPGNNVPGVDASDKSDRHTDYYIHGDLLSVRLADVVVAYLRADETGRGTSFELGIAWALGKQVLLIVEDQESMYAWRFAVGVASFVYRDMEHAAGVVSYLSDQIQGTSYDPRQPG